MAIIDPGPDVDTHVRALAFRAADAAEVCIVLTHGHSDHSGGARRLADDLGAEVFGPDGLSEVTKPIGDGDGVDTDEGALVAVHTPGHTRDHLCFHWEARRAVFVGDLMLGHGDTTWVAEYPGCVEDYLQSLTRIDGLDADVLYPAHGPPLEEPRAAIRRFRDHRLDRIEQVRRARAAHPDASADELVHIVYGNTVPESMRGAARESLQAVLHHLDAGG